MGAVGGDDPLDQLVANHVGVAEADELDVLDRGEDLADDDQSRTLARGKVDPYLRPLFDALYDMLDPDRVNDYFERGIIEVAPLAFMRGRTLNDSFVILDEAQNTSPEQMKMFLTRLGFGSKAVVTGDITQIDLPTGRISGLVEAMKVVSRIEGISFIHFDDRDVVRHKLVQQIVKAYESFTGKGGQV